MGLGLNRQIEATEVVWADNFECELTSGIYAFHKLSYAFLQYRIKAATFEYCTVIMRMHEHLLFWEIDALAHVRFLPDLRTLR